MATLTINKPVIIRKYIGTADAYTYVNYTVGYRYITDYTTLDVGYKNIYYGKAFVQIDGWIEVDITDVIRNYAFRHDYKYDITTQKWVPENLTSSITLMPVEDANYWRTSKFSITETDTEDWEVNLDITTLFFPEYYTDEEIENPYDANNESLVPSINYSGILPRVPWIYTDNYYVGIEALLGGHNAPLTTTVHLQGDYVGDGSIILQGYGNYSASYSLTDFLNLFTPPLPNIINGGDVNELTDIIDAGDADSDYPYIIPYGASTVLNPGEDTITSNGIGIVGLDACPAKYYIQWTTPFGEWQSQPLQSVGFNENSDNFSINTTKRVLNNIENRSEAKFICRSYKVTNDQYKLLSTLQYAPYILLYDVQKDKSYYCVMDTDSIVVRDKSNNQKIIEFNLKQIRKTVN